MRQNRVREAEAAVGVKVSVGRGVRDAAGRVSTAVGVVPGDAVHEGVGLGVADGVFDGVALRVAVAVDVENGVGVGDSRTPVQAENTKAMAKTTLTRAGCVRR